MMKKISRMISIGVVGSVLCSTAIAAPSVEELAQRLEQMQIEMNKLKSQLANSATKQEVRVVENKVSEANEWRSPDTQVHFAGYADVGYSDAESEDGSFNTGTFAPIFHFQYRDLVMLEAELEFGVGDNGETDVAMEYLTIDWFVNDYTTLVAGKFLSPIGQFRQNVHPSWINKLPSAPPGFGHDGAAPVSEVGVQLRGGFPIGSVRTNYAFYVGNGPELKAEFEDGEYELDGVEAEGFGSDGDGEKAYGGRIGILPFADLEIGFSAATGKATVTSVEDGDSDLLSLEGARDYDVIGADFNWLLGSFQLRGEYVETKVGSATEGTAASTGAVWETWYTQGSYRVKNTKLELVTRYTDFDSPHNSQDQSQWALGTNYLFTNNFIGKFSYEFNDGESGNLSDDDRFLLQMAYGF
jgi:hypothetical protein